MLRVKTICLTFGLLLCMAGVVLAQGRGRGGPGGPGGFGGGGGPGGFFGGGGSMMLLFDEKVRDDLGITEDQMQRLQDGQRANAEKMRDVFGQLRDLPDEERRAKFEEIQKKMQDEQKKLEASVLSPAQRDRLKQLSLQSRLTRGGNTADGLVSDEIASDLGITDAQKEQLRKVAEEAQQELREKMQKLQEEAREKVIAALSPAQQQKLKQLMGEKFEFSNQFGTFGGGGFGGGRGGFGGGGTGGRGPGGPGGSRGPGARPPMERLPDGD